MNPNSPQPNFELPPPQPLAGSESDSAKTEQVPARPEQASVPPSSQPAVPQPQPVLPQDPAPVLPTASAQTAQTPLIADDNDLIEKEWVTKAKQIVAATREDPHTQNKEINRFKADYLKKRYNKDIKLEDA